MDIAAARQIRDRESGRSRRHALAIQSGTRKHRELRLAPASAHAHLESVSQWLASQQGIDVEAGLLPHSISIWYDVTEHTLEALETALRAQGVAFEDSIYCRLIRLWTNYSERTQLRNLRQPERLIKKYNETYSKAWEHHAHGDHDDTPPELRQNH